MVGHQPGLTHLSLVCSPGSFVLLCMCVSYQELIVLYSIEPLLMIDFVLYYII